MIISIGLYFGVGRRSINLDWSMLLAGLAVIVALLILAGIASSQVFDLSIDGRDYHQSAIIRLAAGWNPLKQAQGQDDNHLSAWLNHYPRGPWIAAASVYQLTGEIETGKLFTLLLMMAVFFICWSLLLELPRLSLLEATLLAFLAAANPVSITQSLSYTIDGQVAAAYTLVLAWMIATIFRPNPLVYSGLAAALLVAFNIKFTATVYTVLLLGFMLLAGVLLRRSWNWQLKAGGVALLGIMLGVFVVGFNPYANNFLQYGHPFYPLYGGETFNTEFVMRGQVPANFEGKSWGEKLFISLFSPSQNTYHADTGKLKLPLTFTVEELKQFRMSDVRVAGMGPLFSAAILLSAAAGLLLLLAERRVGLAVSALAGLILLTMIVNPEAWWARYAPQLWLIPVMIAAGCLASKANRPLRWSAWILILVLFANIALISGAYLAGNLRDTWRMQAQMQALARGEQTVLVYYGSLESTALKLNGAGVHYRVVERYEDLPCPVLLAPGVFISVLNCASPNF